MKFEELLVGFEEKKALIEYEIERSRSRIKKDYRRTLYTDYLSIVEADKPPFEQYYQNHLDDVLYHDFYFYLLHLICKHLRLSWNTLYTLSSKQKEQLTSDLIASFRLYMQSDEY